MTDKLKPGAHTYAAELAQATQEAHLWSKRRDQLIFDCLNAGWKHREVAEMCGRTTNAISALVSRKRREREQV